jgi:peptidylprolyl isomerase
MFQRRLTKSVIALLVFFQLILLNLVASEASSSFSRSPSSKPIAPLASSVKLPLGLSAPDYAFEFNSSAQERLDIWEDFQCLNCGKFEAANFPFIQEQILGKNLNVVFHPLSFIGVESQRLANAALCAADQNKFLEIHKLFFQNQAKTENSGIWTTSYILRKSATLALTSPSFVSCVNKATYSGALTRINGSIKANSITGTPTVLLNGKQLNRATDYYDAVQFKKIIQDPNSVKSTNALPTPTPFNLNFSISRVFGIQPVVERPTGTPPSNISVGELFVGSGDAIQESDTVTIQYLAVDWKTGSTIENTWTSGPTTVSLARLLPGFKAGLPGMHVGGRRVLILPPDWAYGAKGSSKVSPNATLIFVIDLLATRR